MRKLLLLFLLLPQIAFAQGLDDCSGPQFEVIDDATSGNNTIVAAVASKRIRVLSYVLVPAADVVVRFESGAGGTALTGQMTLLAEDGVVGPSSLSADCTHGCFETAAGSLLNLELSGAVSVDGHLTYALCN